jgi:hypothetical protein
MINDYIRFYVSIKIFALEGLQNIGLCLVLWSFERGESFIVSQLLWHRTSFFSGFIRRTAPFSCLLQHTRGCGGSILTRILTGLNKYHDNNNNDDDDYNIMKIPVLQKYNPL